MPADHERLSRISTAWTLINEAHRGSPDEMVSAQRELFQRYGGAVYRYILSVVRDPNIADDLTQEFALRLVRGDFHAADPAKGRFRPYLKTVLFRFVRQFRNREVRQPQARSPEILENVSPDDSDQRFATSWREELLDHAWRELERISPSYHTVLRLKADHQGMKAAEIASVLTRQMGKQRTAPWVRQTLHRAREKFADLLLEAILHSVDPATPHDVESELYELKLMDYCRVSYERYASDTPIPD